jgi:hypothetical protein
LYITWQMYKVVDVKRNKMLPVKFGAISNK